MVARSREKRRQHYRLGAALFIIISAAATVATTNGFIASLCVRQDLSRSSLIMSSSTSMIEGYEYIHPDIVQMLTGDNRCDVNDTTTQSSLFPLVVDPDTLTLQISHHGVDSLKDGSIMPINQLRHFANHCDDIVFGSNPSTRNVPRKIDGLICLSQLSSRGSEYSSSSGESDSAMVVAAMVSINLLESSIRSVLSKVRPQNNNNHQIKGAPLLSNMIEELSKLDIDPSFECNKPCPLACLSPILKTLLLPTKVGGINLRNLLSHGFLSTLNRRWLSLTLVLIQTLDSCFGKGDTKMTTKQRDLSTLTKYNLLKSEVDFGRTILSSSSRIQELESASCSGDFVPSSHQNLFRFTLNDLGRSLRLTRTNNTQTIPPLSTIFITSMSSLLEHSLRLVWCRVNDRMEDSSARPASYYVTLDGHGQKDKHEVMISPYLSDDCTRNNLVVTIGAQTCALLADLFASPSSEAPNMRAAVCHGYFDDAIVEELEHLADWASHRAPQVGKDNTVVTDAAAFALVSVFDLITSNISGKPRITEYKPQFTYTSMTTRDLDCILDNLVSLSSLINDEQISDFVEKEQQYKNTFIDISSMKIDLEKVHSIAYGMFPSLNASSTSNWGTEDFYAEHITNIILTDCNAARMLLADLSLASKQYLVSFEAGVGGLTSLEPKSTKDRRTKKSQLQICGVASLVLNFYCMALYVALFAIDQRNSNILHLDRADVVKAVERSRMTLSTFDAYLYTNIERSIKSLTQYLQGRSLKQVLLNTQQQ
jgi:hypothetical protein